MMPEAPPRKKEGRGPINIDFLSSFVHSSPDAGADDLRIISTPPAARNAPARSCRRDPAPPPPARGKGRRGREADGESDAEYCGMSNAGLLRDIKEMSDGELQREIARLSSPARCLSLDELSRRSRFLLLLRNEARRRGVPTAAAPKDGDDRSRGARSDDKCVFAFDENEVPDDVANKYLQNFSPIRSTKANYGQLGVQTRRSSKQTGPRNPIAVDKMYSSKTSPTAFRGHATRVRAVDPKERDNEKSWHNEISSYRNNAKRRKGHHEDSSLLPEKVNDVVLLDDEDVRPDEPVDCGVPDKWKDLKIYYPSSDDPGAVELSSSDIKCLNPGVYLSSPVINYYIQYIKKAEMHIKYGIDNFYMFNTYFYSKLQEALLDKSKFLKLRRWWKGVNIFERGYIILPIHGASHWSLIIVCMPAKESNSGPIILHLDSLGMHPSAEIFDTVGRYLEEEWRHLRTNPQSDILISETIWQDLPMNIRKEKVEVPGQNNAYDCGVFMLYYIQRFIKEAPERFTRDSLEMFSRSWFRSEVASGLRNGIRELLLELFGNARVDDIMPEAAASEGLDEECIIKEVESEAFKPCGSSGIAVGGGDASTLDEEGLDEECIIKEVKSEALKPCDSSGIAVGGGDASTRNEEGLDEECIIKEVESEAFKPFDSSGIAVGGGDASTHNEEDFMEVRSLGGTPLTTGISDGRSAACALSEAAMLCDSIDGDDTMKADFDSSKTKEDEEIIPSDGSGMAVGGGGTSTRNEEDFMEVGSLEGTPSTARISDGRIIACALSEAATLSDSVGEDDAMKFVSDSSKTEQDIETLPCDISKNNEGAIHSTPDLIMYCSDSDVEEVKTPEVEKRKRNMKYCSLS